MKLEEIKKYLGQNIILNLINNFSYKGQITKINDDSFEFTDMYNTPMTLDARFVGMIIPQNQGQREVKKEHNDTPIQKDTKPEKNDTNNNSKKPFVMTEEMAISWASENPTENQIKTLKKMKYEDSDIDELSKLDCWKIINDSSKNKKGEYL